MELKTQLGIIWSIVLGAFTLLTTLFLEEMRNWITSTLGISAYTFVTYAVIGLLAFAFCSTIVLLSYDLKKRRKIAFEKPLTRFDPRFKHVNSRLFFAPMRRWHKIRKPLRHWWEIWKQTPSRHKLILVKDLRKAYWVGKYGWNLIVEGKIEWFAEEDQDLDQWCKKEGYNLIPEEADEDKLLEPYFSAEIVDKKVEYRRGVLVLFRTHYRGKLTHGFFDNEIVLPEGRAFSNGQNRAWAWAPDTLRDDYPNTEGNLDGYVDHSSNWSWAIPDDAPLGEYRVYMRVYNHFGDRNRPVIKEKQEKITVASSRRKASTRTDARAYAR